MDIKYGGLYPAYIISVLSILIGRTYKKIKTMLYTKYCSPLNTVWTFRFLVMRLLYTFSVLCHAKQFLVYYQIYIYIRKMKIEDNKFAYKPKLFFKYYINTDITIEYNII